MKLSLKILILLFLASCASNNFATLECENANCTLERINENERLVNEGDDLIVLDDISYESSNDFPYPERGESLLKEGEVPRPKKIFSSEGSEQVEIRRLGEIYWIYAEALPSKAWPLVKDFLGNGYNLIEEVPESGVIRSQSVADNNELVVRVEHGIKNNSSEIYLYDNLNQVKEISFYEDMAKYISDNLPGYQGNSIAAQSLNLNKKARIVYIRKEIGIEFKLSYERAWSAISRALERTKYTVSDRNRELKYIQIDLEESNSGFFNFFGSDDSESEVDYELVFTQSGENTLLEFKKLSNTQVSVNELVDKINENLS